MPVKRSLRPYDPQNRMTAEEEIETAHKRMYGVPLGRGKRWVNGGWRRGEID